MTEPDLSDRTIEPTKETYDQFQEAYDVSEPGLFEGELPNCLITLQRRNRSYGYFSGDRFGRSDGLVTDEIALNPRYFHVARSPKCCPPSPMKWRICGSTIMASPAAAATTIANGPQRMKAIGLQPEQHRQGRRPGNRRQRRSLYHAGRPLRGCVASCS